MEKTILQNKNVKVTLGDKCIRWFDLKDQWNDFQGFTRNVRGLDKAIAFIKQLSGDERLKNDLTMGNITDLMSKFKLKPHTFCGLD